MAQVNGTGEMALVKIAQEKSMNRNILQIKSQTIITIE